MMSSVPSRQRDEPIYDKSNKLGGVYSKQQSPPDFTTHNTTQAATTRKNSGFQPPQSSLMQETTAVSINNDASLLDNSHISGGNYDSTPYGTARKQPQKIIPSGGKVPMTERGNPFKQNKQHSNLPELGGISY